MQSDMIENQDYKMIPGENDHWHIRILSGTFIETVFYFKELQLRESAEHLKFGTVVTEHQMGDDWDYHNDYEWHKITGNILTSLMDRIIIDK